MRGQRKEDLVSVELNQGMSGADLYMGPVGAWYQITNARMGNHLSKRAGYTRYQAYDTGVGSRLRPSGDGINGYPTNPMFVGIAGQCNVVGVSNGGVFGAVSGAAFRYQGRVSTARPLRRRSGIQFPTNTGISDGFGTKPPSVAASSAGYTAMVAVTGGGIAIGSIERSDGLVVCAIKSTSCDRAQILCVGAQTFVLVAQYSTLIKATVYTITNDEISIGTETTVVTLASGTYVWDATAPYPPVASGEWVITYRSAVNTVKCDAITETTVNHTISFTVTQPNLLSISALALSAANYIWVGYTSSTVPPGYVILGYSEAGFTFTRGATSISAVVSDSWGPPLFGKQRSESSGYGNTTTAFWVCGWVGGIGDEYIRRTFWGSVTSAGVVTTSGDVLNHWLPLSKPDDYHRVWCIFDNGTTDAQVNSRVALMRMPANLADMTYYSAPPTIELALELFERPTSNGPVRSEWFTNQATGYQQDGTQKTLCCLPRVLNSVAGLPIIFYDIYEYVTAEQDPHAAIGTTPETSTTIVAGSPTELFGNPTGEYFADRSGSVECGYPHGPIILSHTTAEPQSAGISAGTRYYRAVYQWVDRLGRRHLSEPSPPYAVTLASELAVTLRVLGISATQRIHLIDQMSPAVILFRTLDGGETYRRVPAEICAFERAGDCIVSLTDTYSDASIADEEILYTDGGVYENNLAPSCQFFARDETRLWCGGLWDPTVIQCSKIVVPGEPPQFTDAAEFQVVVDGECTGLAYQDSQLVIFTKDSVQLLGGDGPDDRGGNPYGSPRVIASGVGCINYRSVVTTDKGIIFQSARGYYLLPRGFAPPHFIGAAVDDLVQSTAAHCRSAAVRSGSGERVAQFLVTASASTSPPAPSTILVYDIESGQWTVDSVATDPDETQEGIGEIGVWSDGFVAAFHNLNCTTHPYPWLYQQDSVAAVTDDGQTFLATTLQGCWWHPFGPGGWGKLRKVMVVYSGVHFSLEVTVQTDDATQTATKLVPSGTDEIGYFCMSVARDHCSAVKIQVRDQYYGSSPAVASTFRPLALLLELEDSNGIRAMAPGEVA